ncbi:MAG: adenosylcobalamin-dependent ribonucleoside-diphosphate reductase [Candidatus Micrarchaeaceae archaeon]
MSEGEKNLEVEKTTELNEQKGVIELPKETLEFFNGDEIRARVFYEKYAFKDLTGKTIEKTPPEMWDRVSTEISKAETSPENISKWKENFKWLLSDFRFLPGGRIMFGAGQKRKATLLNCYVIPIKSDSIESIFDWCKEAARTYSYGGGVGTDISILRPKGAPVNNSAVYSTGSVSFMNIFSETTHTIGQSGRRGALMITISVDHPDVLNFINVKKDLTNVRYANISVRITDEFMRAVEENKMFALRYTNEKNGKIEKTVNARELWNQLITSARDWAEPGLIFWDTVKRFSPSEYNDMNVITTNPCSEQPLQPYGACDLGNLNLSSFVINEFTQKASFDWQNFEKATRYAVRFLDDVLDYNDGKHPLEAQNLAARNSRRIGVGVTALGDMLIKLGIKYDSDRALAFVDDLFNKLKTIAYDESIEIAKEKGSFPLFNKEKHLSMDFIKTLSPEIKEKIRNYGLRNVAILTVPPVGSGSVLSGTSSGIEPVFAFSYTRRSESLSQGTFKVYHPLANRYMQLNNIEDEKNLPEFFVPAHKIEAQFRVKMQGVIQKHIDSAISSTVNLPRETTAEQVGQIYMQAWKAGCKGITVYREGSREGILITNEEAEKKTISKKSEEKSKIEKDDAKTFSLEPWERPRMISGHTLRMSLPQGPLYVTSNFDNEEIKEVFINLGKTGSDEKSYCEAIGRLISKYLQLGGNLQEVVSSLKGIKANSSISWDHGLKLYSIPDAIAKALEIMSGIATPIFAEPLGTQGTVINNIKLGQQMPINSKVSGEVEMELCIKCSEKTVVHENGCYVCRSCGYTKCD